MASEGFETGSDLLKVTEPELVDAVREALKPELTKTLTEELTGKFQETLVALGERTAALKRELAEARQAIAQRDELASLWAQRAAAFCWMIPPETKMGDVRAIYEQLRDGARHILAEEAKLNAAQQCSQDNTTTDKVDGQ